MEKSFKISKWVKNEYSFNWIEIDLLILWKKQKIKLSVNELPDWFSWEDSISNARSLTYTLFNGFWIKIKVNKTFWEDWKIMITISDKVKLNMDEKTICSEILSKIKREN